MLFQGQQNMLTQETRLTRQYQDVRHLQTDYTAVKRGK